MEERRQIIHLKTDRGRDEGMSGATEFQLRQLKMTVRW